MHFRYKFHRDRILDASVRSLMESSLTDVFGGKVSIDAILDENRTEETSTPQASASEVTEKISEKSDVGAKGVSDGVLGSLLATFGGEAV